MSFQSTIESLFGELGILFNRFNNQRPIGTFDVILTVQC